MATWTQKKTHEFILKIKIKRAQSSLNLFTEVFTPSQLAYMAVLGQNKVQSNNSSTQLPSDLRNFRFLMHPTRLAIMRLVHEQFSLPASAIKHELDLSWAECTTHITALETKGYISASSEFVEDKISKIIYLEEMGRKEFEELVISIHNFLDSIEYDFFEKKDMLYPTDSKNQN